MSYNFNPQQHMKAPCAVLSVGQLVMDREQKIFIWISQQRSYGSAVLVTWPDQFLVEKLNPKVNPVFLHCPGLL